MEITTVLAITGAMFVVTWLAQKSEHKEAARLMRNVARRCKAEDLRGADDAWTLVVGDRTVELRFFSGNPDRRSSTAVFAKHRGPAELELAPTSNDEVLQRRVARARARDLPERAATFIEDGKVSTRVKERIWDAGAVSAMVKTVVATCCAIEELDHSS